MRIAIRRIRQAFEKQPRSSLRCQSSVREKRDSFSSFHPREWLRHEAFSVSQHTDTHSRTLTCPRRRPNKKETRDYCAKKKRVDVPRIKRLHISAQRAQDVSETLAKGSRAPRSRVASKVGPGQALGARASCFLPLRERNEHLRFQSLLDGGSLIPRMLLEASK